MSNKSEPVARKTIQSMVRAAFHFGARHNHYSGNISWLAKEHKNLDEYGLLINKAINMDAQDETVIGEKSAVDVADAVNKFLGWKLPKDFYPDAGITFNKTRHSDHELTGMWPTGTNLFTADQAREMFKFCLSVYPHPAPALTAELKAELIECLKMGLTAQMYVHGTERKSPNFIKEVYCKRQDKIQAAITKLTSLECGS